MIKTPFMEKQPLPRLKDKTDNRLMTQVRNYDPQLKGVVCKVTKSYLCALNFIYQFVSHDFMHRLGSPGKAVWARQQYPAPGAQYPARQLS